MLFNSITFIFVFLPIVLVGYFFLGKANIGRLSLAFLIIASLVFYAWWNPPYLILLLFSMVFNFYISNRILALKSDSNSAPPTAAKGFLTLGVIVNLALIAYFKYADFAISIVNDVSGANFSYLNLLLPLGISFFTFQQIAYLVDTYRGQTTERSFLKYCLFVSFFPQLIAGPIVHHSAVMPQFQRKSAFSFNINYVSVGATIFSIGLFKKVIFADNIAQFSTPIFDAAASGRSISSMEAWGGAVAYTLQLYFDFSGYSDMAIGLALMFGIWLPLNFNSPYQSRNIIEFWRRWHMTLSQFLRDYLYIPLGGNRNGKLSRYRNLMATMLIGGLWHGAGWTFVIWGGLHGLYLLVNHAWSDIQQRIPPLRFVFRYYLVGVITTFIAVVFAWVFFRAPTIDSALLMIKSMAFLDGISFPAGVAHALGERDTIISALNLFGITFIEENSVLQLNQWIFSGIPMTIALLAIVFLLPNSTDLVVKLGFVRQIGTSPESAILNGRKGMLVAFILGIACFISVVSMMTETPSEFLYFNF